MIEIQNLTKTFGTGAEAFTALSEVSVTIRQNEFFTLLGPSGCGKTTLLRTIAGFVDPTSGTMTLDGADVLASPPYVRPVNTVFQNYALFPHMTVAENIGFGLEMQDRPKAEIKQTVCEMLELVQMTPLANRATSEISGGQQQRVALARALAPRPKVLLLDEPLSALDFKLRKEMQIELKRLQSETGITFVFVTHDQEEALTMSDRIVVMNKGHVMESGPAPAVLGDPGHGYTQKLFAAAPMIPEVAQPAQPVEHDDSILELKNVSKTYVMRAGGLRAQAKVRACIDVNLSLQRGKTLAIVGESGSGKTTCARIALGAEQPDAQAQVLFRPSADAATLRIHEMSRAEKVTFQRQAQMVFQDPYSSLSPRMRVEQALTEPMEIHGIGNRSARQDKAAEMLRWVGLNPDMLKRYPHAFSGGQRQRLSIARALTLNPVLLVCDEPTSALDVSVQEQILTLLERIQDDMGLSYLFISHDLAVVARIADEVAVMRQGVVVEQAPPETLFYNPRHPYTKALIAAQPEPDVNRPIDLAQVALGAGSAASWPDMYRFEGADAPDLVQIEPGHKVRCHV